MKRATFAESLLLSAVLWVFWHSCSKAALEWDPSFSHLAAHEVNENTVTEVLTYTAMFMHLNKHIQPLTCLTPGETPNRYISKPITLKKKKKNVRRTQEITILNYTLPSLHEYETWGKGIFQIPRAEWDALAHHFQRCLSIGQLRTSHVGFHRLMGESHHQELMDTKSWLTSVLELGCCPPLDLGLIGLFPDTSGAPKQFCPTAH